MPEGQDFDVCAVCGRTILRGERVTEYAMPDGIRVGVCALCKSAAEDAGWVPAALAGMPREQGSRRRRGLGLRQRFAKVSDVARSLSVRPEASPQPAGAEGPAAGGPAPRGGERPGRGGPEQRPGGREQAGGARAQKRAGRERERGGRPRGTADASGAGRQRREPREEPSESQASRPASPERRLGRAVEVFNQSRERRKVAGLIRSLGEPQVTVRLNSGEGVLVTVAWELSWYQWEVAAGDGSGTIRETGKGGEIAQLADSDRSWNATTAADGTVMLNFADEPGAADAPRPADEAGAADAPG